VAREPGCTAEFFGEVGPAVPGSRPRSPSAILRPPRSNWTVCETRHGIRQRRGRSEVRRQRNASISAPVDRSAPLASSVSICEGTSRRACPRTASQTGPHSRSGTLHPRVRHSERGPRAPQLRRRWQHRRRPAARAGRSRGSNRRWRRRVVEICAGSGTRTAGPACIRPLDSAAHRSDCPESPPSLRCASRGEPAGAAIQANDGRSALGKERVTRIIEPHALLHHPVSEDQTRHGFGVGADFEESVSPAASWLNPVRLRRSQGPCARRDR
jgi:hypothetical protein